MGHRRRRRSASEPNHVVAGLRGRHLTHGDYRLPTQPPVELASFPVEGSRHDYKARIAELESELHVLREQDA